MIKASIFGGISHFVKVWCTSTSFRGFSHALSYNSASAPRYFVPPPFLSTGIMSLLFNLETSFDKGKERYKSVVRDFL